MKKIILAILGMAIFVTLSQAQSDPHAGQTYISLAPSFYRSSTGGGGLQASVSQSVTCAFEVGRQWEASSLSLGLGKTTVEPNINNDIVTGVVPAGKWYTEIRPSLNVFQQGKLKSTIIIGAGYVFGSEQFLLTEITTGMEYTNNSQFSYSLKAGTYYFTGNGVGSNQVFFGLSALYFFKNKKKEHEIK